MSNASHLNLGSYSTDANNRKNQSYLGTQREGTTRSRPPAYPFCSPDRSGRRPTEDTQLPYTSPEHQAAGQQRSDSRDWLHRSDNDDRNPTSAQYNNGVQHLPLPRRQPTRFWYCCRHGCPYPGPYIVGLYSNCALGCHTPRCSGCLETSIPEHRPQR